MFLPFLPYLICGLIALAAGLIVCWPLRSNRSGFLLSLALIVAGSLLAYSQLGAASRLSEIDADHSLNKLAHQTLSAHMRRLAEAPDDAAEWQSFGRDLFLMGRYREASLAYRKAYEHGAGQGLLFDILTASYLGAGATLDDEAAPWLVKAEAAFPERPETKYFIALRERELGHAQASHQQLLALRNALPSGHPLATLVEGELARHPLP